MTGLQQRRLFEVLFAQHSTRILGYLVRRVDSPEDAADLMAEAFTVAWRRIDDAPTGDEARLWLYGIARNVLANHRRGNSRRGRLATRLGQELAVRAQAMHEPESASRVRDVLATLPERDRELLTLTAWEDMTPGEIATVLDLGSRDGADPAEPRPHPAEGRAGRRVGRRGRAVLARSVNRNQSIGRYVANDLPFPQPSETHVKLKPIALAVVIALAAAGCGGSGDKESSRGTTVVAGQDGAPSVTVTPGDGSSGVRPDSRVAISAGNGTLSQVSVRSGGAAVSGAFSAGRSGWRAKRGLKPGAAYEVTASATGKGGKTTTVTSRFRILKGDATLAIADITPMSDRTETVGVGMPIIVTFNRAVTDRAAVERALRVTAQKPVEGAWRWMASNRVVYRTKRYWPAHQKVRFTAQLTGVAAGKGVYGAADVTRRFAIGAAQISIVNTRTHHMTVRRDGRVMETLPISAGSGGGKLVGGHDSYLTQSGVHLVMAKKRVEHMTSEWAGIDPKSTQGYDVNVNWAVRISSSGEYVHQSNGAFGFLGVSNQSHGCVRTTVNGSRWFFGIAQRGDVVEVTGTGRPLPWSEGWNFWELSWNAWRARV